MTMFAFTYLVLVVLKQYLMKISGGQQTGKK